MAKEKIALLLLCPVLAAISAQAQLNSSKQIILLNSGWEFRQMTFQRHQAHA